MKRRVAVLISGRGSNMESLIAAAKAEDYPAEIALVVSNRADAAGLGRTGGVRSAVVEHARFAGDRAAHEAEIQRELEAHAIGLVCLAGYMRRLTPFLLERWRGRMLNIHPSLLPAFAGLDTHRRALAAGVTVHGCTVHQVDEVLDGGKIVAQAAVPVLPDDTEAVLAARVLREEHLLYPAALAMVAGGHTCWAPAGAALRNPLPMVSSAA